MFMKITSSNFLIFHASVAPLSYSGNTGGGRALDPTTYICSEGDTQINLDNFSILNPSNPQIVQK